MATKKLLRGLKNIHFAKWNGSTFEKPVRISNAKRIENSLTYETETEWADDALIDTTTGFAGGEGTFVTLGLTAEEQALLFGNTAVKGGISVKSTDVAPTGALLFERGKKNSTHRRLYVVYACQCNPASFGGETVEEGKGSASEDEVSYTIGEHAENGVYFYIDTDATDVDAEQVTNWFTTVQTPKPKEE